MTPSLRSERLVLEPYVPADEDDFVGLFLDERVSRYMGDGPEPEGSYRALFTRIFTHVYEPGAFDVWAVRLDGLIVGHAEIKPSKVVEGHELIYALAPDAWGQGLGTELARTIVAYGFEVLDLDQVYATVAEPNTASLAALRKVGLQHVRDITEEDGSTTLLLSVGR
ncbi:GNAT family N-acetyltransferase [Streptomyces sp. NPDC097595]|uniref:GNAT family N-acetyltransferase n=1 Tax=Streptomyces sp. NPDC097595 TaxID=3366090 RepID=UPI0038058107